MKVKVSLSLLFLFALVFTAGIISTDVAAGIPCLRSQCICGMYCSSTTGENCTNPLFPYYLYEYDCQKIPGEKCMACDRFDDTFIGCCRFPAP